MHKNYGAAIAPKAHVFLWGHISRNAKITSSYREKNRLTRFCLKYKFLQRLQPGIDQLETQFTMTAITNNQIDMEIGNMIRVLENRVLGQSPFTELPCNRNIPRAGLKRLPSVLSYFELFGRYQTGGVDRANTKLMFRLGFGDFWAKQGLCGNPNYTLIRDLLHEHMGYGPLEIAATSGVSIGYNCARMFDYDTATGRLVVDLDKLIDAVTFHFSEYLSQLRCSENFGLRTTFVMEFECDRP